MAFISKTYKFSAAHQLPNHNGQCRNLHGHNYTIEVGVDGAIKPPVRNVPDSSEGMVIDFSDLDGYVKPLVSMLDHEFLNNLLDVPTAEVIGLWFLHHLPDFVDCIEIGETDNCHATIFRSDLAEWNARGGRFRES